MRVNAALQIGTQLVLHVGGQPMVVVLAGAPKERLEVVGDQPVEERVLRAVLAVLPQR